ncbi:MAG: LysM peptidoglycan-binding domain-containing protein [Solirubrobacteraceae bacterium]
MRFRSLAVLTVVGALVPATASAAVHTVAPGETLWDIAVADGLSPAAVAAANGLSPEAQVIAGTNLTIPGAGAAPMTPQTVAATARAEEAAESGSSATGGGYQVVPGDSLSAIAARLGVSRAALAAANGLGADGWVIAGTRLKVPAAGGSGAAAPAPGAGAPAPMGAYTVRPGDTLSLLAARSRVPVAQMAAMNGLDPSRPLLAGTAIKLPTGSPVATSSPAPSTIIPSAAPQAVPGRLTAAQIGAIAAQHGVPASLASAIAWQESGFNNAMVSGANARGIMQVMPGTWNWVQQNLSSTRLDPASAADNVSAGSLYLGQLLRQTGGDPAMAAAAYYQGLSSVRRIGMLPETRRYVANVLALRSRFGG